ncbi:MAG: EAL domain-containing protein [Actinobacteria bacterium]|nr:EAL domain-containing protein [Actinomycetota bacterium]
MSQERGTVLRIWTLSALMAGAAVALIERLPDEGQALRPAGWWLVPILAALYALAERTVFHFEFRREAISFSISEVPTAFALVYLAPWPSVGARIVGSLLMITLRWRQSMQKLLFNAALFALELAIAYSLVRLITGRWGDDAATIVVALTIATAVSTALSSVFVALAISFMEGGFFERLVGEMRMAVLVAPLNAMVAAAMVAPTLVSPWLTIIAAVPLVAFWALFRGYGNLEQRFRDLDALHGFVRKVGPTLDLAELAGTAATESAIRLRARRASVVVFDETNGNRRHDVGDPLPQLPTGLGDHRWSTVFDHPEARRLELEEATLWGLERLARVGEVIVAPIADGTTVLGVLVIAERDGVEDRFHPADVARVATMVDQLAPSMRKAMLHQRIEFEARHDGLTALPNRSSFERLVDAAIADIEHGSADVDDDGVLGVVIMMDLDRFKEVNDTLGHHAGDSLLIDFAHRIRSSLQPGDVLARLAGDEFAVLCRRTVDGMHQLSAALVNEARRPFNIDGLEVVVTMSVGVAPMVGAVKDASTMLRRADIAMYTAKNQHTGYELYRDEIDRRTPARLSMLGDLRNALEHHDLQVHLQPKLDLASGVVIGVEALARWTHPQRGYVSPEDFVHVAEETGLIKQLTDLVLEASVEQLRRLRDHGHHLGLAVNLSTHDLLDELLADRVLRRLDQYDVDPALLTLEITESSLLIDAPRARTTIDRLNRAGIRLSVDDFGTGYSSLSYLRKLPVSELKIDRSFVSNLLLEDQDEVIVKSIIDLGHNLGMQVVAEGVETDEIMNRLRGFGCDVAQGFGICRPIPFDQFLTWLSATGHPSRRKDPLSAEEYSDDPIN